MTYGKDLPYGVYIHIPFCKAKCKYCAFVSTPDFSLQKSYVQSLVSEIRSMTMENCNVNTVYFGGGTPSCLYRGGLAEIMRAVRHKFNILPDAEITIECNPESVDSEFISECKDIGVNRISMGLQSACDKVLRQIGRIHTYSDYIKAVELLSGAFNNISSDIILGLPDQDIGDIDKSIETIAKYCSHVSVYALTVENGTPFKNIGYEPSDDVIADMYDFAYSRLSDLGFFRYEVSNFAKSGRESKHNLKYWNCDPYIGLGVAAHGYDGKRTRYMHGDDIRQYIGSSLPESYTLTDRDLYNEYIMLRLRTEKGIVANEFFGRFGYDFYERNKDTVDRLKTSGLVVCSDNCVKIASDRMFVMNSIIEELMLD